MSEPKFKAKETNSNSMLDSMGVEKENAYKLAKKWFETTDTKAKDIEEMYNDENFDLATRLLCIFQYGAYSQRMLEAKESESGIEDEIKAFMKGLSKKHGVQVNIAKIEGEDIKEDEKAKINRVLSKMKEKSPSSEQLKLMIDALDVMRRISELEEKEKN